ncbi:MAG: DUF2723 domain-containing protein [Chloroflexi bacterium]|nr:DUF2723 domain-containing protein [Chloroflexota bacterium]
MKDSMIAIPRHASRFTHYASPFCTILFAFLGGLALTRVLYEAWFPTLAFLGRPIPALAAAALLATLSWTIRKYNPAWPQWRWPLVLLPLVGNLLYLFSPEVDLVRGRVLFFSTLWLSFTLFWLTRNSQLATRNPKPETLLLFLIPLYLLTLGRTVGKADTFEFQVVAPQLGIAHPTGYPLYLLLGKLWTLIPIGSVAWRLNLGTAMYAAAAAVLLYLLFNRLVGEGAKGDAARLETTRLRDCPLSTVHCSLFTAILLATRPTFWGQAVEAEVYTLHVLIVAAALSLMLFPQIKGSSGDWAVHHSPFPIHHSLFIPFFIGLGLTNHLTTVFLIPPALLALWWQRQQLPWTARWLVKMALAGLLPLLLYLYLPWRWWVVNGEAMGWGRFVDWVIGGRFQGALQWSSFLHDPTRYEIVGRLFVQEWGMVGVFAAAIGFLYLLATNHRAALLTLITWLGYTFYCLNYHVPDLAVFLLPAHLIIAIWIGMALVGVVRFIHHSPFTLHHSPFHHLPFLPSPFLPSSLFITLGFITLFSQLPTTYRTVDRSADDGRTAWGEYILNLPLAEGAMLLADSEKIAPLYYLQQAEGLRLDLEIRVEPDEAAYRYQLETAIARGQTVYLARFLPGLEGIYHLRSVGPLTEVSQEPLMELPADISPSQLTVNGITLLGHVVERMGEGNAAATLYWRTSTPINQLLYVYTRWANGNYSGSPIPATGQHPANNYYPTLAWDSGEIVADFHDLPLPLLSQPQPLELQVALAPPFSDPATLEWFTVTTLAVTPPTHLPQATPLRVWQNGVWITGVEMAARVRPQTDWPVWVIGTNPSHQEMTFHLQDRATDQIVTEATAPSLLTTHTSTALWHPILSTNQPAGHYELTVSTTTPSLYCGWLARPRSLCSLGQMEISGIPLPTGATNYNDLIALTAIDVATTTLQSGGELLLDIQWQALAPLNDNYTVFIQVLDANDQIVGQVDSWPVQGTHPTGQWQPGEQINDRYTILLKPDLTPGSYRLIVGWYLLATLQRLPILNSTGLPIGDTHIVEGLVVAER